MHYFSRVFILFLSGLLSVVPAADAQESGAKADRKIDRALRRSLHQGGSRRVIVTVKSGYRAEIRESLRAHGDVVASESPFVNTLAAEIHGEDVEELARHPWVEFVSDDALVYAGANPHEADNAKPGKFRKTREAPTHGVRELLGLPRVPEGGVEHDGTGIGIALIDSGIAPNPDFTPRITAFYDFTRGGIPAAPYDDYGHGTHVAGLIGSSGVLSNHMLSGVAPNVHFVALKVLDRNGQGRTSTVIRALEYVTANRARLRVHVVSLSLGHPIYAPAKFDPLVRAVEAAADAGLIVVVSAGNQGREKRGDEPGYTGVTSPGNAASAITVGSVMTRDTTGRTDDGVAPYSSRGPTWFDALAKPDVLAPGHQLVSDAALTSELYGALRDKQKKIGGARFLELSGTSMAAGVTSGLVALMLDANHRRHPLGPALSANAIKALLQYSATSSPGADPLTQGAGTINGAGAVELAADVDTAVAPGAKWAPFGSNCTIFDTGEGCLSWSRDVIWSGNVFTGALVYYNLPAWSVAAQWDDDNIVWGTSAEVADDNIVWGTTAVWAANPVWSDRLLGVRDEDNIVWGTADGDNIVWGTVDEDNIVWGTADGDNIVRGTDDNIVWGTDDNIVWGTEDNIVWGTGVLTGAGR